MNQDKKIQLMMITNSPEVAGFIHECGVDRIFLDMEVLGKENRQKNFNLPLHRHSYDDIKKIKDLNSNIEVMLRINPLNSSTKEEVQSAIDAGADCIMFPYFHYPNEVEEFLRVVDKRVKTNLLLETAAAAGRVEQILSVDGVDEVHFGLNDLKISLNHDFLFESFAGGLIDSLCSTARKKGLSYGVGGVGRIGKEMLPAELIIKEHVRLGSERVILSRVFHNESRSVKELNDFVDFGQAIKDLRRVEAEAKTRTAEEIKKDTNDFRKIVTEIATKIRGN